MFRKGLLVVLLACPLSGCFNLPPKPLPEWALSKNSGAKTALDHHRVVSRRRNVENVRESTGSLPGDQSGASVSTRTKPFDSDWTGHENAVTDRLSVQTGICVSC